MNKRIIFFLLTSIIFSGCSSAVVDLPQPQTKKEQEREDKIERDFREKNKSYSPIIDRCLKQEFNSPTPTCIYTDTVLTALKKDYSEIPLNEVTDEYIKSIVKNCIVKNSDECFLSVLNHAYVLKTAFLHILHDKTPDGDDKDHSIEKATKEFRSAFFDWGLVRNFVGFIDAMDNHYKAKIVWIIDIDNKFKPVINKCSPKNIRIFEKGYQYLQRNKIKGKSLYHIEKHKFDKIMDYLSRYILGTWGERYVSEDVKEKHKAQAQKFDDEFYTLLEK